MIRIFMTFILFTILTGCQCLDNKNKTMNLEFDLNGLAYQNGQLYTGKHEKFYENNKIKSINTYKKGKKEGEWYVYGYVGEVIQKGNYLKNDKLNSKTLKNIKSTKIEANNWYEGNKGYLDVYVYGVKEKVSSTQLQIIKRELSMQLEFQELSINIILIDIKSN